MHMHTLRTGTAVGFRQTFDHCQKPTKTAANNLLNDAIIRSLKIRHNHGRRIVCRTNVQYPIIRPTDDCLSEPDSVDELSTIKKKKVFAVLCPSLFVILFFFY